MEATVLHFLRKIEEKVPPPENCHHALTFSRHGSDADGWRERLSLQINHDGVFYCFFLDEGDICDWWRVAEYIKGSLATQAETMQRGVGPGQFAN